MRVKICFVALSAYPLLAGINSKNVIGPSVHAVLLARELLKHNLDVTMITYNEGGPTTKNIDGIDVIKTYREDSHLNPLFKAFLLWNSMRKAKAHIYFHHAGASGAVPLFCQLMRKKFVYNIASDGYVSGQTKNLKYLERIGNWLDIKLADAIIAMNEFQKAMLKKNFGKDSRLIKHHLPITESGMPQKAMPPIVLWVGSMAEVKQPELFLRLAQAIPEGTFQMIGGASTNQELYERVKQKSSKSPNLQLLGVIPFNEVNEYFSRASILVNTSRVEGFPYAFIQAWMNYTPVVSVNSNPDDIICRYKLGFHSKTLQQLKQDVKMLLENEQLRWQMGENGRRYVEENHDINNIIKQHIQVFKHLVKVK
ncbi:glycosyltransferase family 4 protein [Dehalococcoidia bacterium]|nr:glycosyltransferase family 4 protein [Dehalococcoidia bacterium]